MPDENARESDGLGAAVRQLSADIGLLVRKELELARSEMLEKAKTAGVGAGMLSGAAVTGLLALGCLTALLIIAISTVLAAWLSALIVTVLWAAVTALLAVNGKSKLAQTGPLLPEQAIRNVKEDIEWAQRGAEPSARGPEV